MRHFIDRDGDHFFCRDERDLLEQIHRVAIVKHADDHAFMLAMALRAELFTGHRYRTDTVENFVADLLATGMLIEKPFRPT